MARTTTVVRSKPNQCVSLGIGNAITELDTTTESLEGNTYKKYQQKRGTYFYQDLLLAHCKSYNLSHREAEKDDPQPQETLACF